jgi:hypothetical protein
VVRERDNWLLEKEAELAAKDMMMREVDHRARNGHGRRPGRRTGAFEIWRV